jgi:hypothetical protein
MDRTTLDHYLDVVSLLEDRRKQVEEQICSLAKEEAERAAGRTLVNPMGNPFGESPILDPRQLPDDRTIAMRYPIRA